MNPRLGCCRATMQQEQEEQRSPGFLRYQQFIQLVCDCKQKDIKAAFMLWQRHSHTWFSRYVNRGLLDKMFEVWLNITMLSRTYPDFGYESDTSWDIIDP